MPTRRMPTKIELTLEQSQQGVSDDVLATHIVLQGLPPDVYALVNHHKVSKDIWDRVKLLMQGTSLSKQERNCNLYDEFDKFTYVKGLVVPKFLPSDFPILVEQAMVFLVSLFTPVIPQQIITSDLLLIRGIKPLFKMVESLFSKFKEDKVKGIWLDSAEGKEFDEEQLVYLADPRVIDGQVSQTITHNEAFQTDDLHAYDFDCDDISSSKVVLMANLSSCDSDVLSKVKANNESKIVNESLTTELERYKERVKILEQRFNVDLSGREKFIDSQTDDMI
ncbi:hypothetical protein Tco_0991697 [Tanacetum coccineum]|uniref:Uncharacterized protein n=1 Tax=Tanacetum coccineum TaxID=301880 RepID=A0ABQ5F0R7_9ASTR